MGDKNCSEAIFFSFPIEKEIKKYLLSGGRTVSAAKLDVLVCYIKAHTPMARFALTSLKWVILSEVEL